MNWFLTTLSAGAAIGWFGMALGIFSYDPWVVTVAFCCAGIECVLSAIKSATKALLSC